MLNVDQISQNLSSIPIELIAGRANFSLREGSKIDPVNFVLSFFLMILTPENTLISWAKEFALLVNKTLSATGLNKALNERRKEFAKLLLEYVLREEVLKERTRKISSKLLKPFNRVFVEDSCHFKLPVNLFKFFPALNTKQVKTSVAKIQLRIEMKTGKYSNISLDSFRDNDQGFSSNILHGLRPNDLVIRDLGYWALWVFRLIDWLQAFYLSRYRFGTYIYDIDTGEKIDIAKMLRKARRNKIRKIDKYVLLGSKAQIRTRFIAILAPAKVTRQRRAKAAKHDGPGTNHSKEYMEMLAWTMMVTNIKKQTLSAFQLLEVYGYRWRIEIIFKAWKSGFS